MRVPVNARVTICTHTNSGSNRDSDGCKLQDRYMACAAPQYAACQECASRMSQPTQRATRAVHTDNAKHSFSKQCTSLCVRKSQELTRATCAAHTDVSQSSKHTFSVM
jgi:Tfp pilus assembly protein PilV